MKAKCSMAFLLHMYNHVSLSSTWAWMILCLIFVGFQTCFLFYFVVFRSTVLHSKEESVKTTDFIGQLPAFVLDAEVTEAVASAMSSPNLSWRLHDLNSRLEPWGEQKGNKKGISFLPFYCCFLGTQIQNIVFAFVNTILCHCRRLKECGVFFRKEYTTAVTWMKSSCLERNGLFYAIPLYSLSLTVG